MQGSFTMGGKCADFNASKTVVILFSKSNIEKRYTKIKRLNTMDKIKIPFSKTVK